MLRQIIATPFVLAMLLHMLWRIGAREFLEICEEVEERHAKLTKCDLKPNEE